MQEKIICFSLGLSPEDIEKGQASLYGSDREARKLEMIPLTDAMLALKVEGALENVIAGSGPLGDNALPPGLFPYRMVVVNTQEREQVLQVMRSFKAALPDPQDIIFAVITDTARTWTFGDYIVHLAQEHEYRKTCKPGP